MTTEKTPKYFFIKIIKIIIVTNNSAKKQNLEHYDKKLVF
jgi:hypothetical protein